MADKDYCVGWKPVSDCEAAATEDKDDLQIPQFVSDVPPTATDDKDDLDRAQCVHDGPPAATDSEDDFEKTQCVDDDPPAATDSEDDLEKANCVDDGPGTATGDEDNQPAGKGSVASRGDKIEDDMDTSQGNCATEENKSKLFYIGQRISSIDELERLIKDYEDRTFCELWKKRCENSKGSREKGS